MIGGRERVTNSTSRRDEERRCTTFPYTCGRYDDAATTYQPRVAAGHGRERSDWGCVAQPAHACAHRLRCWSDDDTDSHVRGLLGRAGTAVRPHCQVDTSTYVGMYVCIYVCMYVLEVAYACMLMRLVLVRPWGRER